MTRRSLAPLALLPLLLACPPIDMLDADALQLESAQVQPQAVTSLEGETVSFDGVVVVDGQDADWTLEVVQRGLEDDVILADIGVHSPGHADLASLDAVEGAVHLYPDWFGEAWSLSVEDGEGAAYFLDMGLHLAEAEALFGEGFLRHGEQLAQSSDGTWRWTWTTLALETDEGPIVVEPGEVRTVVLRGATYRFTAIAAWTRDALPDAALPGCPTADDLLSYELLRIESPAQEQVLTRPAGSKAATAGCL